MFYAFGKAGATMISADLGLEGSAWDISRWIWFRMPRGGHGAETVRPGKQVGNRRGAWAWPKHQLLTWAGKHGTSLSMSYDFNIYIFEWPWLFAKDCQGNDAKHDMTDKTDLSVTTPGLSLLRWQASCTSSSYPWKDICWGFFFRCFKTCRMMLWFKIVQEISNRTHWTNP